MDQRTSGLGWPTTSERTGVNGRPDRRGLGWPAESDGVERVDPVDRRPIDSSVSRETSAREPAPADAPVAEAGLLVDRDELVRSLPEPDEDTPLARQVALDARRRIVLHGQQLPAPVHTRVMTVANQKGGVGKTTTTVNLAAALAQSGLTVLVIDIDPQGNASTALGIDHHAEVPSIYDVLVDGLPMADVVQACPDVPGLYCAPATIDLAGAEIELVSLVARESRLNRALVAFFAEREASGAPRFDYVLIDCPPSLGLLTVNAFVAAREVFIPIQCEYYALEGLTQLLKNIELIQAHLNPDLHVSTILLTMFDARTRLSADVAAQVREHFADVTLRTSVPRSVRISEAPSHQQTVMTYDPGSSGALSYLEAAKELALQGVDAEDTGRNGEGSGS
jgi:chromosome partitioning protein